MTKALALRENQVRAIIRAARKEGARLEVKLGEAVITVFPDDHAQPNGRIDEGEKGYL
jgi:5-enolpyruvylshikimate-3-phosphate synthase